MVVVWVVCLQVEVSPGSPSTVLKRLHCTDPSEVAAQLIHRPSKSHWVLLTDSSWLLVLHTWEEVQLDCRHQEVRPKTRPTTCRPDPMLLYGTPARRSRVKNFERTSDVLHHVEITTSRASLLGCQGPFSRTFPLKLFPVWQRLS